MNWPWRRKASAPRYVDAPALIEWAHRYAFDDLLEEKQRRAYRHMLTQIGRMEWHR